MTSADFWDTIQTIVKQDFTPEGLTKLEEYADKFIHGQFLFKRFSPQEQYGCAAGGPTHVIASILSGAENPTDSVSQGSNSFKGFLKQGARQASLIESWARKTGIWLDDIDTSISTNLGDMIAEGGEAKVYDNGASLLKTIGPSGFVGHDARITPSSTCKTFRSPTGGEANRSKCGRPSVNIFCVTGSKFYSYSSTDMPHPPCHRQQTLSPILACERFVSCI